MKTMIIEAPVVLNDDTIHALRKLAVRNLEVYCNGSEGRPETDPFYVREITEGRDAGAARAGYSSCGDLAHAMLYDVGVRSAWINRDELDGWKYGAENNVNTLMGGRWGHNPIARPWDASQRFEPGDVGVIYNNNAPNNTHVFCVIDQCGPEDLLTAEGGQPGTALYLRKVRGGRLCAVRADGTVKLGRQLQWRLPFDAVVRAAFAAGDLEDGIEYIDEESGHVL